MTHVKDYQPIGRLDTSKPPKGGSAIWYPETKATFDVRGPFLDVCQQHRIPLNQLFQNCGNCGHSFGDKLKDKPENIECENCRAQYVLCYASAISKRGDIE